MATEKKIILFDGVCNLCNGAVQFIIKRDRNDVFRFAPLQSEVGKKLADERKIDTSKVDSIILIEPQLAYYTKSDAALRITRSLSGLWPVMTVFLGLPSAIRDWIYDWVAKNRYRWFGKKEQCMIPTPETKNKFLAFSPGEEK
ncbi:thiol-disulfide oxidoreductase DCC family protein [Muriicola soli]|uniref:Thiol-disulfide oxidoreductase DCC family protein n=1 Tax=Muriicola soli TaxID=2507538 RepID=A0A411E8S4_9FLAO|nr:thiol-disulfide oxidoreductase DCC family protein [Muriicola soli]QBA64116.1 thiol-disulfide oxidoreductase DCC family protein [Muriicola soli]